MTAFPQPDAPSLNDLDSVRKEVAANEAETRAKALAGAVRCKDLRIVARGLKPKWFAVVSVTKGTPPRKFDVAHVAGFIHRNDAEEFIYDAQKMRADQ